MQTSLGIKSSLLKENCQQDLSFLGNFNHFMFHFIPTESIKVADCGASFALLGDFLWINDIDCNLPSSLLFLLRNGSEYAFLSLVLL